MTVSRRAILGFDCYNFLIPYGLKHVVTSPVILEAVVCDESHFALCLWEFKKSFELEIIEKQELMERDFPDFSGFFIQVQLLLGSIRENQRNSRKM